MSKQVLTFEVDVPDGYEHLSLAQGDVTTHVFDDKSGMVINLMVGIMPIMTTEPNPHAALIAQCKQSDADMKAFPLTWFKGWQFKNTLNQWAEFTEPLIYWGGGNEIRRHLHAEIIMQCDQDTIDYPSFYEQLHQWKTSISNSWETIDSHEFSFNYSGCEYRQHPHRESIIKWHSCSDDDKKRWEYQWKDNGTAEWIDNWMSCRSPEWSEKYNYRLCPRTCKITLQNGDVLEYPEPVREYLVDGDIYYAVSEYEIIEKTWYESDRDYCFLDFGLIHLTEQAAQQHLEVLQAVNVQAAK